MYLSELSIKNFRKYGNPGLNLKLNKHLNVLVGENDSGKSTIVEAIKFVLNTYSNDYIRLNTEDFHLAKGVNEEERANEIEIVCVFRGFTIEEAKHFLEWLHIEKDEETPTYSLKVVFSAKRKDKKVYHDITAGGIDTGKYLNGEARNLLKTTFLKPLRDAEIEMTSRRNSRLSQVLINHSAFENEEEHELVNAIKDANARIMNYFIEEEAGDEPVQDHNTEEETGAQILKDINEYLENFSSNRNTLKSRFNISDIKLKSILERLQLNLEDAKPGLGSHNILFIATELLFLQQKEYEGLKLALIEEIEAHLHTQAQMRLIDYLQKRSDESDIQIILTTHSTSLASKIPLETMFICQNDKVFSLNPIEIGLLKGDYLFLERFLDSTKADLFFAQGVIMVEGDAENILIPTIAKIIGIPLSKNGITVLNVGSTAFLRYSRIFIRSNPENGTINIPVSCITDLDLKPEIDNQDKLINPPQEAADEKRKRITVRLNNQNVKAFISPIWTLEHDFARSSFQEDVLRAVLWAKKIQNSDTVGLTDNKKENVKEAIKKYMKDNEEKNYSSERIAYEIYENIVTKESDKVSKAIIAQCLSDILLTKFKKNPNSIRAKLLSEPLLEYLVNAIKYAAGVSEVKE
ncbi:DNA replication and repair protein RecF [Paraliobacillus ryukyuensis]|uniref:Putative ATP-dependent endonuclease of OLD family n=1 Tax=Paraliobacillus ryukyuensis TaxID=200904 RepID=A0A366E4B9_9BACI|nr:AAA family ATPase [Paraliobacillus ryukyuensis]RBO97216.1 putative ATP-dependent endonuclease of OLD family [Paraliobacillus ryukyuensis]